LEFTEKNVQVKRIKMMKKGEKIVEKFKQIVITFGSLFLFLPKKIKASEKCYKSVSQKSSPVARMTT
jgi:hypothetical protein